MKQSGSGQRDRGTAFCTPTESSFGSYEVWKAGFVGVGKMRDALQMPKKYN
jgi:hypothetical protein